MDRIVSLRNSLRLTLKGYEGRTLEGVAFNKFIDEVQLLLPGKIPVASVYHSLRHLAGVKLTAALLRDNFWRLAGNLKRLKVRSVPPWTSQTYMEWVPAQIERARRYRTSRGRVGWLLSFRIMAGRACSLLVTRFWSDKFCRYVAKEMGFMLWQPSDKSDRLPHGIYKHATELVTLRLHLLIDPELCTREPGFEKVKVQVSDRKWNQEQLKFRDRLDAEHACPHDQPKKLACYQCPFGYLHCRAAVHRLNYTYGYCASCGTDDVPFDPEQSTEICLGCVDREAFKRR